MAVLITGFCSEMLTRFNAFFLSWWKNLIHVQLVQQVSSGLPGDVAHILYQGFLYFRKFVGFPGTRVLQISFTPARIVRPSIPRFLGMLSNITCRLTLNLLPTTIIALPNNASKWQMGFNSAFKGLILKNKE